MTARRAVAELTLAALSLAVFLWLAEAATDHTRWSADRTLLVDLHRYRAQPVVDAWLGVTQLGSYLAVAIAGGAVAWWVWRRWGQRRLAAFVVAAIGGEMVAGLVAKAVIHRPRPHLWKAATPTLGYSFPSAHAMNSLALVAVLVMLLRGRRRAWAAIGGTLYIGLVAVSRVWLGAHYPTDILAGWTLALGWVLVTASVVTGIGLFGSGRAAAALHAPRNPQRVGANR